jgi:hypothetical protein
MIRVFAVMLIMSLLSATAFSQASATAATTSTIIEPVGISKSVSTEYGSVAIILVGSVEMTPIQKAGKPGRIVLPVTYGTYTAMCYSVSGNSGYNYTITVPSTPVTVRKGSETLKVTSFSSEPNPNPDSGLAAGVFVSVSPFNIIVNYN